MPKSFTSFIGLYLVLWKAVHGIRQLLSDMCCLNSLHDLIQAEPEIFIYQQDDISTHWSDLWSCANEAMLQLTVRPRENNVNATDNNQKFTVWFVIRMRLQLEFIQTVSCVRRLMVCRRLSGESDHIAAHISTSISSEKAQCAFLPLCFFYLFSPTKEKNHYVYRLCSSMSDRSGPYFYGSRST